MMVVAEQIMAQLALFPANQPLVVVPVYNAYEDVLACVAGLCASLPQHTPIVLVDDGSSDPRIASLLRALHDPRIVSITKPHNSGFVDSVNLAFSIAGRRDVVIVNSDVIVPADWLSRLQAAAYSSANVASATPFTNNGAILSLPVWNMPQPDLPAGMSLAEVDRRIQMAARPSYPHIPTAIGHCVYFRRSALDVIGAFDEAFSPGYGEEVDWSQRAVSHGFCHVLADSLFVFHHGSRSFDRHASYSRQHLQRQHDALLTQRYPWYPSWIAEAVAARDTPLADAFRRAAAAILGTTILIDATCVRAAASGTETATLGFVAGLARAKAGDQHLAVLLADPDQATFFQGCEGIGEFVVLDDLRGAQRSFDLVIRPYQIYETHELALLRRIARRLIIFHLDSIRFANPSYAPDVAEWRRYRSLTQLTFALADGIGFISEEAALDAARHGLRLVPERSAVVYLGVEATAQITPERPGGIPSDATPFVLVLGASYQHKNRVLALRVAAQLFERYNWPGALVLAGPDMLLGGSNVAETEFRMRHPALAGRVFDLGAVSEAHKQWLLKHAALVLFMPVVEGFGLIPFEAAAAGTPTLLTPSAAIQEIAGPQVQISADFDAGALARQAWHLLTDGEAAARQVAALQARAACFTWQATAARTLALWERLNNLPPRVEGALAVDEHALNMLITTRMLQVPPPAPPQRMHLVARARTWRRNLALALHIARLEGLPALLHEVRRRVRWRLARI